MRRDEFLRMSLAGAATLLAGVRAAAQDKGSVGNAIPPKSTPPGIADGDHKAPYLNDKGDKVDQQVAEDDIPNQLAQIENMITKGVKALVVAAIDGTALSGVLSKAAERGIKVVAYDRLIRSTKHVDYYATFDNFQVGVLQGESIVDRLGLKQSPAKGPFNIELFAGSPDDNNAGFFYEGALSVLKPWLANGKLVVRSQQTGAMKVGILRWDGATAQARMDNLLSAFYTKDRLHAVLSPSDVLSVGIISSLKGVGYGTPKQPMPVVTGQDADLPSVKAIVRGDQASTVFKDTRELARVAVNLVDTVLAGKAPEVNDTKTYDNGVKVVPSVLLKPVPVDATNWKKVLVDSGYYKERQIR